LKLYSEKYTHSESLINFKNKNINFIKLIFDLKLYSEKYTHSESLINFKNKNIFWWI